MQDQGYGGCYNQDMNADSAISSCQGAVERIAAGNLDGALEECSRIIATDPTAVEAYCYRSIAKRGKGDTVGAIADLEVAIGIISGNGTTANSNQAQAAAGIVAAPEGEETENVGDRILKIFAEMRASIPKEAWDKFPTDLAERHDYYANRDWSKDAAE